MKIHLAVLALLVTVLTSHAAPPSDQSIEQMMKVAHIQAMLDQMLTQMDAGMQQGMQQALKGKDPTPAQRAKMAEFQKKLSAMMKDELSFAKTKDIYVQVYRETFTQEEINGIIAFYSSPAGKAMVEKLPVAMQKAGTLMQARMGPIVEKMQKMMETFQKDLEATK